MRVCLWLRHVGYSDPAGGATGYNSPTFQKYYLHFLEKVRDARRTLPGEEAAQGAKTLELAVHKARSWGGKVVEGHERGGGGGGGGGGNATLVVSDDDDDDQFGEAVGLAQPQRDTVINHAQHRTETCVFGTWPQWTPRWRRWKLLKPLLPRRPRPTMVARRASLTRREPRHLHLWSAQLERGEAAPNYN